MNNKENNLVIGRDALEFIDSYLTPEEKVASDLRVELIGELITPEEA